MNQLERPLTLILAPLCLILFFYGYVQNEKRIASEILAAEEAAYKLKKQQERQAVIDAQTINIGVYHDNDPETNTIAVTLSAESSYDSEGDEIKYYWKQISGDNVAKIKETRREPVLIFDAKAGNYGFELAITDNYGASCVDTVYLEVSPEPNSCPVVRIDK